MENEIDKNEKEDSAGIQLAAPVITSPRPGDRITPGFLIEARSAVSRAPWRVQIHTAQGMLREHIQNSGPSLSYRVPSNLIAPGTAFYFRVDYKDLWAWSSWAWSGDKVMSLEKPDIHAPGPVSSDKPLVSGRGYPGATIKLYQAGYGGVVHGTAEVAANGEWQVQVTEKLWAGEFPMTANQTLRAATSDWAETKVFNVLPIPVITQPAAGSVVTTDKPLISGRGYPGATVKLYRAGSGAVVHGIGVVDTHGDWRVPVTEKLPSGPFPLTVNQTHSNVASDWAQTVTFTVHLQ